MIAKVIVDVPAKQTNRAFDYGVPLEWESWIEVGSRVGVPFGPRVIQGFVIALQDSSDIDPKKLKMVAQILDLVPPLTPELVELSGWMSHKYMCHEITALQAMIPGALKAKYERMLSVGSEYIRSELTAAELEIVDFVVQKGQVEFTVLTEHFQGNELVIKDLLRRGLISERQTVKDRMQPKKRQTVFPPSDLGAIASYMEQIPSRSNRQKDVLAYFDLNPEPLAMAELTERLHISSGTVKSLADKGWLTIEDVETMRDPYAGKSFARTLPLELTEEQQQVYEPIVNSLESLERQIYLLHGVTGSGKTEVYLQSIQRCLELGRDAVVLVPEIALTPQMVDRFKGRFGDLVAVLHSRLSQGERYDEWRKIQRKQVRVVIGARSAVFAPLTEIGLIIIDEEHESSYKQEESPKYHARDVAAQRALYHGAVVILGSATPSIESYYSAIQDDESMKLLTMEYRVEGRPLPAVEIVDMREELKNGNRSMFSRQLFNGIEQRLARKEQMVLLLNRRGYATFVLCRSCGFTAACPHCEIKLTYHQRAEMLRCHYCGYAERQHQLCPTCGSEHIRHFGTGTQKVEEELMKLFPSIRVIRMDVDTTNEKGAHEKWLTMFRDREADVLLGTQMVAKGLDFPDVTLVGVIAADSVLNLPDFRSVEKTFQLLTQVAGRAGRHRLPGEVFIQTYNPDHYSMLNARQHDYRTFYHTEIHYREQLAYPPYSHLTLITLAHEQIPILVQAGEAITRSIRENWRAWAIRNGLDPSLNRHSEQYIEVLGPVSSPIARLKDRYRYQCVVKYRGDLPVADWLRKAMEAVTEQVDKDKMLISVDVDPQSLM
ncbi:MAG: primosomal protein N' [Paenibacillaceae bacterium]